MYANKVEITGVNTSKLKVLKEKEKEALLKRVKQGDKQAREELINGDVYKRQRLLCPGRKCRGN